ncbi:hypothetical protein GWK47_041193 [Chionoecetes opilio]|uniref:Uncharacterized protein n=1 Tax=Chionoecetes opilio TaxID=41210 RepID=A0A8J5CZK8_CHIOP|nr:hypothetical protein GWK47_041193 [Chionoecetes opilio]
MFKDLDLLMASACTPNYGIDHLHKLLWPLQHEGKSSRGCEGDEGAHRQETERERQHPGHGGNGGSMKEVSAEPCLQHLCDTNPGWTRRTTLEEDIKKELLGFGRGARSQQWSDIIQHRAGDRSPPEAQKRACLNLRAPPECGVRRERRWWSPARSLSPAQLYPPTVPKLYQTLRVPRCGPTLYSPYVRVFSFRMKFESIICRSPGCTTKSGGCPLGEVLKPRLLCVLGTKNFSGKAMVHL